MSSGKKKTQIRKKLKILVMLLKKNYGLRFIKRLESQVRLKPFNIKYESPSPHLRLTRQIKYQILFRQTCFCCCVI